MREIPQRFSQMAQAFARQRPFGAKYIGVRWPIACTGSLGTVKQLHGMRDLKLWCVVLIFFAETVVSAPKKPSGVEGVVTLDGSAFAGVEVEASSASIGAFWETSTNRAGYYSLDDIRPGRYTMWAEASGHGCIVIPRVLVKSGEGVRQDFHFAKGKTYPGCESLKHKKPS